MRQFLKKIASYDTYSLLRVAAVATAGSALLSNDPDYRDTFSRWNSVLSNESSLSAPWRLNLSNLGSLESNLGSFPINFFVPSQCGGPGSQAPHDDSRHKCQCLGKHSIANAAAKIGPAVVNISVPQGVPGLYMGKSMGSGTIIDPDGTILTCAHVLMDYPGKMGTSNSKVEVTLQDGRIFEGTVLNADLHSDVAIIKIKSRLPLPYAKIGTSSQLRPGDWVIAVGCPLSLQNTVTAGIVSCVDRKSSDLGLGGMRREYLQTDCAINKGNSGGPLVNMDGEVVGLNVMKVLAADGLSFSVPIDSICKIIDHFKKSGRVVRPWIGLKMIDLNEMIIAQLKDKDRSFPNVTKGILVPMVIPGSPGERAGFLPGDVVIEFDHKPVGSIKEVVEILDDKVGVAIKVVVKRKNNVVDLVVIPEEANTNM